MDCACEVVLRQKAQGIPVFDITVAGTTNPTIDRCPLHANAERLLAAAKESLTDAERGSKSVQWTTRSEVLGTIAARLRAAISAAEARA